MVQIMVQIMVQTAESTKYLQAQREERATTWFGKRATRVAFRQARGASNARVRGDASLTVPRRKTLRLPVVEGATRDERTHMS